MVKVFPKALWEKGSDGNYDEALDKTQIIMLVGFLLLLNAGS